MKKYLILSSIIAMTGCPSVQLSAQQKKGADLYAEVRVAMDEYDFDTATDLLEKEIARLQKRRKPTEEAEQLLTEVQRYAGKLEATERVVFVDSVVVDKDKLLSQYPLSGESGSLYAYSTYFQKPDTVGCVVFKNQLGNHVIFAQPDKEGRQMLWQQEMVGTDWTSPARISGLDEEGETLTMGYPYMLSDGATLYYAAVGEDGLGGYDIYMTRYDVDSQSFLTPENIGMPFNSPANDYMYAVDEYNNLGWFATDRNQPEGKVCVYTFIPNPTRRLYSMEEMDSREIGRRARITSIRDTWTEPQVVKQAQSVLASLSSTNKQTVRKGDFEFVLSDARTCVLEADFKNPEARQQLKWWLENRQSLTQTESRLSALRDEYAAADADRKNQLAPQIRLLEGKLVQTLADLHTTEKNIRRLELGQE